MLASGGQMLSWMEGGFLRTMSDFFKNTGGRKQMPGTFNAVLSEVLLFVETIIDICKKLTNMYEH